MGQVNPDGHGSGDQDGQLLCLIIIDADPTATLQKMREVGINPIDPFCGLWDATL
jgi:hypothetical protein